MIEKVNEILKTHAQQIKAELKEVMPLEGVEVIFNSIVIYPAPNIVIHFKDERHSCVFCVETGNDRI